jgi:hypothetical protein
MTNREVLVRRFAALMASINTSRLCRATPNLGADAIRRLQARIDQDVNEGLKVSALIAELDLRKPAGAVEQTGNDRTRRAA